MNRDEYVRVWEVINSFSAIPFAWDGVGDCCTFTGKILKAFHGSDPMKSFTFANKREAVEAIREHGDLLDAVIVTLGHLPEEVSKGTEVKDGDLLLAEQQDGSWIPGVVFLGKMIVRTGTSAMDWPIENASYLWRMPECLKQP